ncbi:MAG: 2-iminoacetate synthase ThiH [Eubacteriales bacterium]|nr:2-iminoacetate synthase ThiH [Eubacteriales bacterium]
MLKQSDSCMAYDEGMDILADSLRPDVLHLANTLTERDYTVEDVAAALTKDMLSPADFAALLSPAGAARLEMIATAARAVRHRYFGNSAYLFTPLYLSNYCENHCVYCGFHRYHRIRRMKLDRARMAAEMAAIAATGLEEILLLTGESRGQSDPEYIGAACRLATKYFKMVGLEVYPMNVDEYAYLHDCGADYVTVFQETYHLATYGRLHLAGHKRSFPYRFDAQERAVRGGMRGVGFAALLGLSDFRRDALATGLHAHLLQRRYPHAEIALSCPRLRPVKNGDAIQTQDVRERDLLQVMCAYRLFLPFAQMTISTRERSGFRDRVMDIAATKISAGVSTGIGTHAATEGGDEQFDIADRRDVATVCEAMRLQGLQVVTNDYIRV